MSLNPHAIPFDTSQETTGGNGHDMEPCEPIPEENNGHPKTIEQVMAETGIAGLKVTSTPEQIVESINKFVTFTANKDSVWKGVAKSEIVKRLKEIKVQGATELITKAFGKNETSPNSGKGQEIQFDDPEPWPDPVDGAELLDEISGTIQRYVILPEGGYTALSLWILFSWLHDAFSVSPILDFRSPTKRCGKTTGLKVVFRLVPRPLIAANISTAALFRSMEYFKPTLIIDEIDTFLKFNEEIHGVLNAGHERDGAFVLRVEGDDLQPKMFCVWGPKVLAGIGKRKDTLEDRSISISMKRKGTGEKIEKFRRKNLEIFSELKQKAARWAEDNFEIAESWEPKIPESLNDRAADNWEPLLIVAEIAGGQWPELARETALLISGSQDDDEDAIGVMLLSDIRDYFHENETDRVTSEDLGKHMVELEDRPWPEYRKGKPISKTGIARLLKPFGITPKSIRVGTRTPKGYLKEWFEDVFTRYLPNRGIQSATAATELNNKDLDGFQSAT
ncbi:MAG: DUF3631 domain-containing protein, partial [Nitrospinae bacterium]|nr:DUF3631 domain-containing protein [Nitrospinota bacterium]